MVKRQENENALDFVKRGLEEKKKEKSLREESVKSLDNIIKHLEKDEFTFLNITPKTANGIFGCIDRSDEDALQSYKELISQETRDRYNQDKGDRFFLRAGMKQTRDEMAVKTAIGFFLLFCVFVRAYKISFGLILCLFFGVILIGEGVILYLGSGITKNNRSLWKDLKIINRERELSYKKTNNLTARFQSILFQENKLECVRNQYLRFSQGAVVLGLLSGVLCSLLIIFSDVENSSFIALFLSSCIISFISLWRRFLKAYEKMTAFGTNPVMIIAAVAVGFMVSWNIFQIPVHFKERVMKTEYNVTDWSAKVGYSINEDGTASFSYWNGKGKELRIAEKYQAKNVTRIEDEAVFFGIGLTSVEIPDTVTEIGKKAFYYCTDLTSVEIPDSVAEIGKYAFYGCRNLTGIRLPNSLSEIKDHVFSGCSSLMRIEIPDSVTAIGKHAFYGCRELTSVKIPETVTMIHNSAFLKCDNISFVVKKDSYAEKYAQERKLRYSYSDVNDNTA